MKPQKRTENKKPAKPSIQEQLHNGAIALAKQEIILEVLKNDPEFAELTDQNQHKQFKDVESMQEITTLEDGTFIAVQKFNIFVKDGEENKKVPVINWCPCSYQDILKIYKITEGDQDTTIGAEKIEIEDFRVLPSFLGKNIKKVFSKIQEPKFEIETFVNSYVKDESFALSDNIFYRLFVENKQGKNFNMISLKAARDTNLSPRKQRVTETK